MKQQRDERIREITDQLESGIKDLFQSDRYRAYLSTMSKFTDYSFNNTFLIAMQRPDATAVAGFRAWEDKFDRHVKKGSKGIAILEPIERKYKRLEPMLNEDGNPILNESGDPQKQLVEKKYLDFKLGYVFAYEDTVGTPLPSIVTKIDTEVPDYDRLIAAVKAACPVPIIFEKINSGSNGFYSSLTKDIHVDERLPDAMKIKTSIHEYAHALAHDTDRGLDSEATRQEREVTAESVAFTVCSYLGLDTKEYSFGYIGEWAESLELKELQKKMEVIRKTASTIITGIQDEWMKWEIREKEKINRKILKLG